MAVFPKLYKWAEGSYPLSDGMLISPDLKNPKYQVQQAAHSMMLDASSSHTDLSFRRILGVMGRRDLVIFACLECSFLIPLKTCLFLEMASAKVL